MEWSIVPFHFFHFFILRYCLLYPADFFLILRYNHTLLNFIIIIHINKNFSFSLSLSLFRASCEEVNNHSNTSLLGCNHCFIIIIIKNDREWNNKGGNIYSEGRACSNVERRGHHGRNYPGTSIINHYYSFVIIF